MSDIVSIREATKSDVALIHAMLVRLAKATRGRLKIRSTVEQIEKAMSGDRPAIQVFLAERAGETLGIIIVFLIFSTWRGTQTVYVQDIFVDSRERGSGLGKRLLAAAARWGATQGAEQMRLSVDSENVGAQKFYEGLGLLYRDDEKTYELTRKPFARLKGKA